MDAFGKVYCDIREIARTMFPEGYGRIFFPRRDNPSLIIEVHDHELKQVILRLQDENGIDVEKKYRADVKKKV